MVYIWIFVEFSNCTCRINGFNPVPGSTIRPGWGHCCCWWKKRESKYLELRTKPWHDHPRHSVSLVESLRISRFLPSFLPVGDLSSTESQLLETDFNTGRLSSRRSHEPLLLGDAVEVGSNRSPCFLIQRLIIKSASFSSSPSFCFFLVSASFHLQWNVWSIRFSVRSILVQVKLRSWVVVRWRNLVGVLSTAVNVDLLNSRISQCCLVENCCHLISSWLPKILSEKS